MTVVEGIRRLGESLFLEVEMSTMGSCREPAWGTPPVAKVMRKEASAYAKAGSSLRKPPVPEHLPPKPESVYFTALCFSYRTKELPSVNISMSGLSNGVSIRFSQAAEFKVRNWEQSWSGVSFSFSGRKVAGFKFPPTLSLVTGLSNNNDWYLRSLSSKY